MTRSIDHFTSADVRSFPLANFTCGRSENAYVFSSGEYVHDIAKDGLGEPIALKRDRGIV